MTVSEKQIPAIHLEQFTYQYPLGNRPALCDVSLQIQPGELVAVIGANDAGKSTLCYALSGFIPRFFQGRLTGQLSIYGQSPADRSARERVLETGLVFQNPVNQISGAKFTVAEEVAFGLENLGIPAAEMKCRVKRAMQQTGIAELAERSPFELSGGQQQRLALAAILAMSPRVLILDEPTSQLDPVGSQEIFTVIRDLCRQGITVVLVEHKLDAVAEFADRVLVLHEGRLVLDGSPREVLTSDRLVDYNLEAPCVTRCARGAREKGCWESARALPVRFAEAVEGFHDYVQKRG